MILRADSPRPSNFGWTFGFLRSSFKTRKASLRSMFFCLSFVLTHGHRSQTFDFEKVVVLATLYMGAVKKIQVRNIDKQNGGTTSKLSQNHLTSQYCLEWASSPLQYWSQADADPSISISCASIKLHLNRLP